VLSLGGHTKAPPATHQAYKRLIERWRFTLFRPIRVPLRYIVVMPFVVSLVPSFGAPFLRGIVLVASNLLESRKTAPTLYAGRLVVWAAVGDTSLTVDSYHLRPCVFGQLPKPSAER